MKIGVPKERKTLEKRIAITPQAAGELTKRGHDVLIETGAGLGSGYSDTDFTTTGCTIASTLAEVWNSANLLVKVKEPHPEEYKYFREDLIIFDYLHLASLPEVASALLASKVTSLAYELVQESDGSLPLLEPMSDIAGKLSVINGAYYLLTQNGGRGVLLGGTAGVAPEKIVIVGAGIAGLGALEIAYGLGAETVILDINQDKLSAVKKQYPERVRPIMSGLGVLAKEVVDAELVVGAVLVPGAAAPKIITEEMISSMQPGSVFVDISIDQGGCGETIRPTTLEEPVFVYKDVLHYGVTNMPSQTATTSTKALSAATLPYIIDIAESNGLAALKGNAPLRASLHTIGGKLTNAQVGEALGIESISIDSALNT